MTNNGNVVLKALCFLVNYNKSNGISPSFYTVLTVHGSCFLIICLNLFLFLSASRSPSPPFLGLRNSLLFPQAFLFSQKHREKLKNLASSATEVRKNHLQAFKSTYTHTQIKQRNHFKGEAIIRRVCIRVRTAYGRRPGTTNSKRRGILSNLIFF